MRGTGHTISQKRAGPPLPLLFTFPISLLPVQVSSRTSPSVTRSMGSFSAPTCAPPSHQMPHPQAAPLLWPMGLCTHPSRKATERLDLPSSHLARRLRAAPGVAPGPQVLSAPA